MGGMFDDAKISRPNRRDVGDPLNFWHFVTNSQYAVTFLEAVPSL